MPTPAEFEEKEYEIPLYIELYDNAPLWSPGQVLEARLGVDAAVRTLNRSFWSRLGYALPLVGFNLNQLGNQFSRANRPLPNFQANLLIQVKRPTELKRRPAGITVAHLPGSNPYWRFEIRPRQHTVLTELASTVGHQALVAYAAPAFADINTLYDCIEMRTLIDRSTFIRVDRLQNHRRWVYDEGGSRGTRCSMPQRIEDPSLLAQLDEFRFAAGDGRGTIHPIQELAGTIDRVVSSVRRGDPRTQALVKIFRTIDDLAASDGFWMESDGVELDRESAEHRESAGISKGARDPARILLPGFAKVGFFAQMFGLEWFVVEPPR
jgi:hypothetical protein